MDSVNNYISEQPGPKLLDKTHQSKFNIEVKNTLLSNNWTQDCFVNIDNIPKMDDVNDQENDYMDHM